MRRIYLDKHFTKAALHSFKDQLPPSNRWMIRDDDGELCMCLPGSDLIFKMSERPLPPPMTPEEIKEEELQVELWEREDALEDDEEI